MADRLILAALGRKLSAGALLLVQPATILAWHRALVYRRWAAFGRRRGPGRPKLPAEYRELVLRLARENPLWGYERIRGELLKLGHRVSSTSIRNLLRRQRVAPARRRAGLTWRRFLHAQGRAILACDYFTVDTAFLKRLYVLFFPALASRRILFTACSEHSGGAWAAQQARNLAWQLQEAEVRPPFLIHGELGGAGPDPDEIAFDVDSHGFEDVLARARRMGLSVRGPLDHTPHSRGFYVSDPDGRRVEIIHEDRGVFWQED